MESGHTKFSPDRHFGWMKNRYNNYSENIETYNDCINCIKQSNERNLIIYLQA